MESGNSIESDDYLASAGQVFNNRYAVISKLGSGAFSTVWRCLDSKTDCLVALKIQKSSGSCTTAAKREAKILGEIDHPNIIKLLDKFTYYDPQPTTVKYRCLVFELCDGDLYDLMENKIEYGQIKKIIRDILTGLSTIHTRKIIHTDIKPENILLLGDTAKITDFGTSDWEYRISQATVGTRYYRAPESLVRINLTTAIDIWALGCVLFELCTGDELFHPHTYNGWGISATEDHLALIIELLGPLPKWMHMGCEFIENDGKPRHVDQLLYWHLDRVLREKYNIDDPQLVELLGGMLAIDPNQRWTADRCLEHSWFS